MSEGNFDADSIGRLIDRYHLSGLFLNPSDSLKAYINLLKSLENFLLLLDQAGEMEEVREELFLKELRSDSGPLHCYYFLINSLNIKAQSVPSQDADSWNSFVFSEISKEMPSASVLDFYLDILELRPDELIAGFLREGINAGLIDENTDLRKPEPGEVSQFSKFSEIARSYTKKPNREKLNSDLIAYFQENSGGELDLFHAFHPDKEMRLKPISEKEFIRLDTLYGVESQLEALEKNLENFLAGKSAHHVLLWGYRGTGKSTAVLQTVRKYHTLGIRVIEFPIDKISEISRLLRYVGTLKEKFVLLLDDLSFSDQSESYKILKTKMEGGLEGFPTNVLIHATSNRRDLVERSSQPLDERSDASHIMDEIRAIDDRFGLKLFFDNPLPRQLRDLFDEIAEEYQIEKNRDDLYRNFLNYISDNRMANPGGRAIRYFLRQL